MASTDNISSITLPGGGNYELKDAAARLSVSCKSAVSVDGDHADVNMVHISLSDYSDRLIGVGDEILSNELYVVSSDYVETYGQQIKNVADPTDLSDAVNKEYVDSNFQPAGNYLTAVPSAYKTYAATLSSLSSTYSLTSHTHSQYSLTSHNHTGVYAPASHAHGNVTSTGTLTATGITISSGDSLVVVDSDQSSKIAKTTITFDGSSTNQYLSKKGTWQSFPAASTSQAGIVQLNNSLTSTLTSQAATANAVKLTNDKLSSYLPLSGGNMTGALSVHYGQYQGPTGAPYVKIDAYENQDYSGTATIQIVGDIDAQPYLNLTQYSDDGSIYEQINIEPFGIVTRTGQDWSWPWLGSLSSQDGERTIANNSDIRQYCAFKNELGYTLSTATGVLSSGSYVYKVADRTMTTIGINQSTTPVVVQLPAAGSKARDFILRIEISSSAAPTFTFTNTAGLDFESEDDDWAVMQPGVNLVSFTETKR